MPEPTNAQVLRKTQDILRERGWWNGGTWAGPEGCLCAGAAVGVALGMPDQPTAVFDDEHWNNDRLEQWDRFGALMELLSDEAFTGIAFRGNLYAFNDAPGRTLEQVLDLLERAAVAEEGKERGEASGDPGGQGPDHHGGGG